MVARKPNGYPFHSSATVMQKSMKQMIPAGAVNQMGSMPESPAKLTQLEMYTSYLYSFFYIVASL